MIDPASSFLAGHVGSKVLDRLASTFKTHVIERWSRRRAEVFFDQFCSGSDMAATGTEDDVCSEVLFDAYRRVALTKSKELGPRMIALLTAELVVAKRIANEIEDAMFLAAENLSDDELLAFVSFVRTELANRETEPRSSNSVG